MLRKEVKQYNFYSGLYHRIPKNHILKRINEEISFEFVEKMVETSYCVDFGRPAKEPEMMFKLLMLQRLYNLSDERVMEETQVNLAYMYFIGINPDEPLPHASLLAKFRTMRLKDVTVDDMITEIVRQSIDKGIINAENGISEDTTHILANTTKLVPERIMKHLAKKIFKAMGQSEHETPDYKQIEDHKEAKRVMKEYLETVIETADETAQAEVAEATRILESPLFIEQKGIRSLVDTDARVGYKSKTDSFFGYKMEVALTTDGRLITAVDVHNGAYVDGTDFNKHYEASKKAGLKINAVYGDKAYFKKHILDVAKDDNAKVYIPVNACSYRIDEDLFSYNKDSDQWICKQGYRTISKKVKKAIRKDIGEHSFYEYEFDKNECINCLLRSECIKTAKTKAKKLRVGLNANEFYEYSQWAKTEEFKTEYKKRAASEWKNAELKRFHGLNRAYGYGLKSVSMQAKLTALAVNLKRIARLLPPKNSIFSSILTKLQLKIARAKFQEYIHPISA
jgi:transposase